MAKLTGINRNTLKEHFRILIHKKYLVLQSKAVELVAAVLMKSTARTVGNQIGRQIISGIMGSLFGEKR